MIHRLIVTVHAHCLQPRVHVFLMLSCTGRCPLKFSCKQSYVYVTHQHKHDEVISFLRKHLQSWCLWSFWVLYCLHSHLPASSFLFYCAYWCRSSITGMLLPHVISGIFLKQFEGQKRYKTGTHWGKCCSTVMPVVKCSSGLHFRQFDCGDSCSALTCLNCYSSVCFLTRSAGAAIRCCRSVWSSVVSSQRHIENIYKQTDVF